TSEGQELDSARRIVQLEVRRDVNRIPEADITLIDGSVARRTFELSDASFFEPGKRISISVRDSAGNGEDTAIFEGRVVRHAVESRPAESLLRVELKDEAFKLTRQRKSAVFRHQADEDVMRRLIDDAELEVGELASTEPEHDELIQFYASDWDFLVSR